MITGTSSAFVMYCGMFCFFLPSDPHCPLLPANSRCRRSNGEVQDLISYPMRLHKSFSSSSFLGPGASSSVTMVSGLHPAKMNCSRVFNLFCLYGNVEKVGTPHAPPTCHVESCLVSLPESLNRSWLCFKGEVYEKHPRHGAG